MSVGNHIFPLMPIHVLTLWSILKAVTKGVKISACCFVTDVTLYPVLLLNVTVMEKVHQLPRRDFVSKGQQVYVDFVNDIFINK